MLRAREARCIINSASAEARGGFLAGVVLRKNEEPGYAKEGSVGEVDGAVEDVEPSKGETMKG